MTENDDVLVEARGVSKRFGATQALAGVDLVLRRGEIHALLGPNGAGKSTFIKIFDGVHEADGGTIETRGRVAFIHQDLGLVPDLTVRDNLGLAHGGGIRRGGFLVDGRAELEAARRSLATVGLDVDPDTMIRDLGLGERTLVAVARALDQDADVLVLDEVTAGLTAAEAEWLFAEVEKFVGRGGGVIVVSHRLQEIVEHCHTVTLFRDGAVGYQGPTPDLAGIHGLFAAASKRGDEADLRAGRNGRVGKALVELLGLRTPTTGPLDLTLHAGEVVGIVGSLTSGLFEVGHVVAGHAQVESGLLRTEAREGSGPARVGFVPEDRWGQGLLAEMDIATNVSIGTIRAFATSSGWVRRGQERERAEKVVRELDVRPARIDLPVGALSGGNAQKVLLGRAATLDPDVYVLCEPTRGVDITTREAIYRFIEDVRARGAAVLIVTIDVDDAVAVSDRIAVMREGRLGAPVPLGETTVETLLEQTS